MLLIVVLLLNCYRAANQSITVDEANTYENFVSRPILKSLTTYDAGHHILHTFACILFVRMFGAGVLPLRLTSLIFSFVYLWAVWRLSVQLFPSSSLSLVGAALFALNPSVFDFMSAARGYGMALAFFAWAMLAAFQICEEISLVGQCAPRIITKMAILAALSVGANLTFAFPVAALFAAVALILYREVGSGAVRLIFVSLVLPAAATFALFAAPLLAAKRDDFYFGANSLQETMHSLYQASFNQDWPLIDVLQNTRDPIHAFLPYVLLFLGGVAILATIRLLSSSSERDARSPQRLFLGLCVSVLVGSVVLLAAAHHIANVLYPYSRTSLYILFLCPLVVLLANLQFIRSGGAWRAAGSIGMAASTLVALLYTFELRTQWYGDWRFDAGTASLMHHLSALRKGSAPASGRLSASWQLQPSAEFYREIYHIDWLRPVIREVPSCEDDYFLIAYPDPGIVDRLRLEVIRHDRASGTTLAQRTAKSCASQ